MPDPSLLVVEDGTGKGDANTYASLAQAELYLTDNIHAAAWTAASDDVKAWALMAATRLLDYHMKWVGARQTDTQALEWPRKSAVNKCSNVAVAQAYLPVNITYACVELALDLLVRDRTRPSSTDQSQISKIKVEGIEIAYNTPLMAGQLNSDGTVISDGIAAMLRCYGTYSDPTRRGVRFGRMVRK